MVTGSDHPDVGDQLPAADHNDPQLDAAAAAAHLQDERPAARHRVVASQRRGVVAESSPHGDCVHHHVALLRPRRRSTADRDVSRPTALQPPVCLADVLDSLQAVRVREVFATEGLGLPMDSGL